MKRFDMIDDPYIRQKTKNLHEIVQNLKSCEDKLTAREKEEFDGQYRDEMLEAARLILEALYGEYNFVFESKET